VLKEPSCLSIGKIASVAHLWGFFLPRKTVSPGANGRINPHMSREDYRRPRSGYHVQP